MMFVFAYIGSLTTPPGWPVRLIYLTEAAFVIAALVCAFLATRWRGTGRQLKRDVVAVVGGASAGFGLIMPFELAPFFFNVSGEIMLGTIALILVYPIAVVLFVFLFHRFMNVTRENAAP